MVDGEYGFAQCPAGVRFEWGASGAAAVCPPTGALVIVDVLSFSTAVAIVTARGTAVYPHPWPAPDVETFAADHGAAYAVRRELTDAEHPWSLSPAHLLTAAVTERLVLPSPNGSAIAARVDARTVVAGSLRNATAVGQWLSVNGFGRPERPASVIAAGERWPDGTLRPALEDLLGAGAIIAAIDPAATLSPEATAARAAWNAHSSNVRDALERCSSGRELASAGYAADVVVAAEHDAQDTVPLLVDEAFSASLEPRRLVRRCE